jgi:hypothetical protein
MQTPIPTVMQTPTLPVMQTPISPVMHSLRISPGLYLGNGFIDSCDPYIENDRLDQGSLRKLSY